MAPKTAFDPVPDWLRETRLRQRRDDGKPWTQDDLLARMRQEIGWAPHRPNYSKYESGKSKPETVLPRFVEFWSKLGEPGPDYTPKEEAPAPEGEGLSALVAALTAQTAAQVEQTRMIGELVSELRAARGLAPELRERVAAIEAYAEEHERRLVADRQRMGLTQTEDSQSESPQPVEAR